MRKFFLATIFSVVTAVFSAAPAQAQGWRPLSSAQANRIVRDVHRAFFYRAPDFQAQQYWAERLLSDSYPAITEDMTYYVSQSLDFDDAVQRYGAAGVIENTYRTLFNRPAGTPGYQAWASYIDHHDYHAFVFGVLASLEFQQSYGIRQDW